MDLPLPLKHKEADSVVDLGMGYIGRRPGQHLAGGGMGCLHKENKKKTGMVTFA